MSQAIAKRADPGVGDLSAPRGSELWAQAVRIRLQSSIRQNDIATTEWTSQSIVKEQAWTKLNKPDGSYFESFEEFCRHPDPWGLGIEAGRLWAMIQGGVLGDAKVRDWSRIQPHPAADLFPMIGDAELETLAHDIAENGLIHPIVLLRLPDTKNEKGLIVYNWQLLDGRNRLKACQRAGVTPHFVEWRGHGDPTAWVISTNLHRRHLTDSQRAMVAARARETVFAPAARERQVSLAGTRRPDEDLSLNCGEGRDGNKSADEAAAALNVSRAQVERAATVLKSGTPELVAAVDSGEVAVSSAAEVSRLPAEEQRAVVAAGPKAVKEAAKAQREAKKKPASGPRPVQPKAEDAPPSAPISSSVRDALESKGATPEQLARVGALDEASQREVAKLAVEGMGIERALFEVAPPPEFNAWLESYLSAPEEWHLKAARIRDKRSILWPAESAASSLSYWMTTRRETYPIRPGASSFHRGFSPTTTAISGPTRATSHRRFGRTQLATLSL